MFPEDRVLVGVINRKKDLKILHEEGWYRIPQKQMPRGVYIEYLAFYLSGSAARGYDSPGIHYYAERGGIELRYRRDLFPDKPDHPRAGDVYYKVHAKSLTKKTPPVLNPTRRPISFIYSTWDRFVPATTVKDLYSTDDYFVDRIYHALRDKRLRPERYWGAERRQTGYAPQLRIVCERGTMVASTESGHDVDVLLDETRDKDAILDDIRARIASLGGPVIPNIPHRF